MLLFLYSLLILQPTSSQTAAAQCEIGLDSTLSSTSSWLSPSGRFAFGYYPEEGGGGFNVGILFMESPNKRTVIWTAKIGHTIISVSNATTIKLVEEGLKLLNANSQGQELIEGQELISSISETNHSEGRFRIRMQEDSNLVMYPIGTDDIGDSAYWASDTDDGNYSSVILGTDGILFLSNGY
ncbi:hypothetical protein J5N97_012042 [Dioscorea zingiberensis]|uniref:Bulb-type lectin domain-containing protein n=1 Tax=Dioscorea zingiberensis TaxID=325984 RepID=A0A9D5CQQ4_9LILI|nr:hypothetical protein J5N97_012042 [Dioscorea zingiberensis]